MTPPADPLDFSDRYNTPIPPEKQAAYEKWRSGLSPGMRNQRDYDVQGAFLNGNSPDARDHMTDQFKKPNHPTFSDESKYHGVDGYTGGTWIMGGGRDFFQTSPTNLKFRPMSALQHYFGDPLNGDTNITPLPPLDVKPPNVPMPGYRVQRPAPPVVPAQPRQGRP